MADGGLPERGGIRGGFAYGETDEMGMGVVENPIDIHDLHATMLHCLGVDHERLTFRFGGRDVRLTDVDPGFRTSKVVAMHVVLPDVRYRGGAQALLWALMQRLFAPPFDDFFHLLELDSPEVVNFSFLLKNLKTNLNNGHKI